MTDLSRTQKVAAALLTIFALLAVVGRPVINWAVTQEAKYARQAQLEEVRAEGRVAQAAVQRQIDEQSTLAITRWRRETQRTITDLERQEQRRPLSAAEREKLFDLKDELRRLDEAQRKVDQRLSR